MLKGKVTNGPDRLSVLMALGSCFEAQPITPEFALAMDEPGETIDLKIRLRISELSHESGAPGMYILKGEITQGSRLPQVDHLSFYMFYNANRREGHVTFYRVGEKV